MLSTAPPAESLCRLWSRSEEGQMGPRECWLLTLERGENPDQGSRRVEEWTENPLTPVASRLLPQSIQNAS